MSDVLDAIEPYRFPEPLEEAVIVRRKSQFTMAVLHEGEEKAFHCPTTGRMQRHVGELAASLESHQKAVLLTVFIYDNPGFQVIERSTNYEQVRATVDASVESGVEIWQATFELTPECVRLRKRFPIEV